ncbi:MAG: hypothetical protein ACFWTY_21975 [Shouchella clausii]
MLKYEKKHKERDGDHWWTVKVVLKPLAWFCVNF